MTYSIKLRPDKILVQPTKEASSSFSTESKKYERKSIAVVTGIGDDIKGLKEGDTIVYDDSHSVDFSLEGTELSIITPDDIVAKIKEDK